jgi:hypothetical protein
MMTTYDDAQDEKREHHQRPANRLHAYGEVAGDFESDTSQTSIGLRVSEWMKQCIQEAAASDRRTVSNWMRVVIEEAIDKSGRRIVVDASAPKQIHRGPVAPAEHQVEKPMVRFRGRVITQE